MSNAEVERPPLTLADIAEGLKRIAEVGDPDLNARKVAADAALAQCRTESKDQRNG